MTGPKAVFLDRDGVLNRALVREGKPFPPASPAELEIFPDAVQAIQDLRSSGFELFVVTNQPDVARGKTPRDTVERINAQISGELGLVDVLTCYHDDADDCACRKPKPGFMHLMRQQRGIDLSRSFVVGDRWRDVEAGRNAGCRTVFIDRGYDERKPLDLANHVCTSLGAAASWIIAQPDQGA